MDGRLQYFLRTFAPFRPLRFETQQRTAEQRIERLTAALQESVVLIAELETEIRNGREQAIRLQEEVTTYDVAAKLTKEQAAAIMALLNGAIEQNQRKSLWQGFVVNVVFFILGVIASMIFGL